MSSDLDYRAIRRRVDAGIVRQKFRGRIGFLVAYVFSFIVFMIVGWGIFLSNGGQNVMGIDSKGQPDQVLIPAMIMLSLSGIMGLIFQIVSLSMDTKRGENRIRERLVAQEINREMLKMGLDDVEEHEKRKGMMRLTDDGELEEVEDPAELDEEMPLKRQR